MTSQNPMKTSEGGMDSNLGSMAWTSTTNATGSSVDSSCGGGRTTYVALAFIAPPPLR